MASETFDDVEYAKKLQLEFDQELAQNKIEANNFSALDSELATSLQQAYDKEAEEEKTKLKAKSNLNYPTYSSSSHGDEYVDSFHREPRIPPSKEAIRRITSDIEQLLVAADPSIHIYMDENDIAHLDALIIGPDETPYAGGFFHFELRFPHNYPWKSPSVLLITTDSETCRFNPNLYANGKVCLSILGTWSGPAWTPVQTCMSVLLSIQSLMNKFPYHNEPGCESESRHGEAQRYNDIIEHETVRVAVCGMMENPTCSDKFWKVQRRIFRKRYQFYREVCKRNLHRDGTVMNDPFGGDRGMYKYQSLLDRLDAIKAKLDNEKK